MAKEKHGFTGEYNYYVGVLVQNNERRLVDSADCHDKYATWTAGAKPKVFNKQMAIDLQMGLMCNGYKALVIEAPEFLELQNKEALEEKKAVRRLAKAQKKAMDDYNQILDENRRLKEKVEYYKREIATLSADLEGRPVEKDGPSRIQVRKAFNKLKNRRAIMDAMGYPYNVSMPVAYNVVLFLEWVRNNDNELMVTLGCGDIGLLADEISAALREKNA